MPSSAATERRMAERKRIRERNRAAEALSPADLARRAALLALDRRAEAVVILDLRELSAACDYFVIATGLSDVHVKAVADHVEESLAGLGVRPWHVEGRQARRWVLMDFVDVVVHLFHRDAREFYRLENLWADAPREELSAPEGGAAAAGGLEGTTQGAPGMVTAQGEGDRPERNTPGEEAEEAGPGADREEA